MRNPRTRVPGAAFVALIVLMSACGPGGDTQGAGTTQATQTTQATGTTPGGAKEGPTITVASFNFAESEILAEIYAQALEAEGYPVETNLNLGSREIVKPALEGGEIDFVLEYCGTLLTFLGGEPTPDTEETCSGARSRFEESGVTLLQPASAQDKNGFVVTQETAQEFDLSTVSDLAPVASELVLGGPPECPERQLCLLGLQEVYGIEEFQEFRPLEIGPIMVEALQAGEIDVAVLFTTDGFIAANDLVLLEDDQGLQPAENVVPAVRTEVVDAYGEEFVSFVNSISEQLTTDELTALNARVQIDQEDPADVAGDWLEENGFL
ncbi:MAG: ABC transporter substrate-binding protein [Actinomycetota bacterium]|nr:ABC transporter substrate-binding protein [Actinomycetota bacterium]